jgi:hypothetical protein
VLKIKKIAAGLLLFTTSFSSSMSAQGENTVNINEAQAALAKVLKLNNEGRLLKPEGLALVTGEAKSWQAASLGKFTQTPDKILPIDTDHVVARVQWLDKNKHATDYYFYLSRDKNNQWLVESCRSLASIGMVAEAQKRLQSKKNRTADQNYQLRNMALMMSSDAQFHTWFTTNKMKLDGLANAARALPKPYPNVIKANDKKHQAIAKMIVDLNVDSLALHQSGEIQVIIGGVNRDFVGLLNAPSGKHPKMSDKDWIWLEDLGGNWFFFKHT